MLKEIESEIQRQSLMYRELAIRIAQRSGTALKWNRVFIRESKRHKRGQTFMVLDMREGAYRVFEGPDALIGVREILQDGTREFLRRSYIFSGDRARKNNKLLDELYRTYEERESQVLEGFVREQVHSQQDALENSAQFQEAVKRPQVGYFDLPKLPGEKE
jgi:hypothetical protein